MNSRNKSSRNVTTLSRSFCHFAILMLGCCLLGCWTVREPVAPEVQVGRLSAGRQVRVQLAGFDAHVTTYVQSFGYSTITTFGGGTYFGDRYRPRYYDSGMGTTMVSTTEFLPKTEQTDAYRNQATDLLEHAGCVLQTNDPQYRVEVRFEGPVQESGDGWAAAGWTIFTLLTADYGAQDWTAKLKIHDVKTGKLIYEKDHLRRYEAVVWGPIPFFSPLGSDRTSNPVMQDWCLSKLTEATVADALEFLSTAK